MFLVELVLQGVRGARELTRLRFQNGFNFVSGGNESGKTSAADTMLRLLFPGGRPESFKGMISRFTPDSSRAALVAYADNGAYYRVIVDFAKQGVNLSKYNAAAKDFSLLYKDWDSTAQFMAGLSSGILENEYERLFVLRRDKYEGNGSSPAAVARRPEPVKTAPPAPARNAPQETRLAELRETLRKSEEAADAEYRAQAARLKLEEIRKKQERLAESGSRSAEINAELEKLKGCENLPGNLVELLDAHERRQDEKMAKSDELTREISDLKQQLEAMPQLNLLADKLFILGLLLLVFSVVAGLFLLTEEQSLYFPMGVLFSLVLITTAWYKGSAKNTERKAVAKEIEDLEAELGELEKSFEQGGSEIEACMKETGSKTAAELKDKAENYRYFLSLRDEHDQQRRNLIGALSPDDLQAEYEKQQAEVKELEAAAAAVARFNVDAYSLRQDIERLEQELSGGVAAGDSGVAGMREFSLDDSGFAEPVPARRCGFAEDLAAASRISGIEMATLVPAVEAAAQRNLAAASGGKFIRIEAGLEGDPQVHASDDSTVNYSELSHGTRDLVHFCLRTGLVEALAGKLRLPFILDDPLTGFDPGRQQAACRILRTLGTKTQVILFTSNPALKSAGDAAAELR
jgi:uncharacterized protein YhaN